MQLVLDTRVGVSYWTGHPGAGSDCQSRASLTKCSSVVSVVPQSRLSPPRGSSASFSAVGTLDCPTRLHLAAAFHNGSATTETAFFAAGTASAKPQFVGGRNGIQECHAPRDACADCTVEQGGAASCAPHRVVASRTILQPGRNQTERHKRAAPPFRAARAG